MSKKLPLDEIKRRTKYINPNMHILNDELPKDTRERSVICHCDDCGGTFNSSVANIRLNYTNRIRNEYNPKWCPVCSGDICIQGINDVATVRPDIVQYFVNKTDAFKYTVGSHAKVLTECPICKSQRLIAVKQLCYHGYTCTVCSDSVSYPNKVLHSLLKQLPINNYTKEYIDNWTQGRKYDAWFELNRKNYLLEFDGGQHYHDRRWSEDVDQREIDALKNKLAKDNDHILIRVDCRLSDFNYIKNNIYRSMLSELFNLDEIDWEKCALDAEKNIIYEVANYYNLHDDVTASDVGKALNLEHTTVLNYLKKATSLGLCKFDADKSRTIACRKNSKNHKNKKEYWFDVYDANNEFIDIYTNQNDCIDDMNSRYKDLSLTNRQLYKALNTGTEHKGFKFLYREGLLNHYKDNDLFFEICDYYSNHYNLSIKQVAMDLNKSSVLVGIYIAAGINSGYIKDQNVLIAYANRHKNQCKGSFYIKYKNDFVGPIYGSVQCENKLRELYPDKKWNRHDIYKMINGCEYINDFIYNDVLIRFNSNN